MSESNPLAILLSHDHWATTQLLRACTPLTSDQFHHRFDIGFGSLHDTLTHMVAVIQTWTHTLAGQEPRPRLDSDGLHRTPEQLLVLLDESYPAFVTEAHRLPLDETTTRRFRTGELFTFTRAAILTHATTHGTHHRAQCLNMLRQLGVTPLPPSSVAEWTRMGEQSA